jgi:SAM-dependent methyltransferase
VIEIRITKKGKALLNEKKLSEIPPKIDYAHDRKKQKMLSAPGSIPFLQAVGIMTRDGKVKADMQRKYRQINEYLRLVDETDAFTHLPDQKIHVVDFGCGNAYLTFAIYFYLNEILGLEAYVTGVDVKADLLEKHREKAVALNWERLNFHVGQIVDYRPDFAPEVVIALHACDTATDDALALGIRWGCKLIVAAPCCQHELQQQLSKLPTPEPFKSIAHYGILNERLGDILTDTLRAAILQIMGYHTEVIQFVSTEHTAKNLMIRAVKNSLPGNPSHIEEYVNLKNYWQVKPYLETLLGSEYAQWLQD